MSRYLIGEWSRFRKDLDKYLPGMNPEYAIDLELTSIFKRIFIRMDTLEKYIIERYAADYENMSMEEVIKKHKSNDCAEFIKILL